MTTPAVPLRVENVSFAYAERLALEGVSLRVQPGEIYGLLGPNGSGKTTLFRLTTTLLPVQKGLIEIGGHDVSRAPEAARRLLGVTFQSPSLDGRLTVAENLRHHGHLYGLRGRSLAERLQTVSEWLGIADRQSQMAQTLSGGLKRRVEIAKSLLHQPRLLVLDEPSTGLDPGARLDLWQVLDRIRRQEGVSLLITTHLMDEAERCDRLGILDRGRLIVQGEPQELREQLGGHTLTITAREPAELLQQIRTEQGYEVRQTGDQLRLQQTGTPEMLQQLAAAYAAEITAISLAKPTLEDVFLQRTGHRFWDAPAQ